MRPIEVRWQKGEEVKCQCCQTPQQLRRLTRSLKTRGIRFTKRYAGNNHKSKNRSQRFHNHKPPRRYTHRL